MFFYFGYGSNLSVVSLRAKGVEPLTSEPAVLEGWRLAFNIPDFFAIEGGTGNIEPVENETVHGVLHGCRARDLAALDQLEALGITYRRVETTVTTYSGRRVRAFVYLGLPAVLDSSCRPSERYRNILVRGAVDMRLDSTYVARLRNVETHAPVSRRTWGPPPGPDILLSFEDLAADPGLTALAGMAFDMSKARPEHDYLRKLFAGKDVTLLFLKRMDTSTGAETFNDVRAGNLDAGQRAYLNAYLHEFAREYRFVGHIDYGSSSKTELPVLGRGARPRTSSMPDASGQARASRTSLSAPPDGLLIAAREVLARATAENLVVGHENDGSLSEAFGFMPRDEPQTALPPGFEPWDEVVRELPSLYRTLRLRKTIDALPLLRATPEHLPDKSLLRAAQVLGMLSHAYHYVDTRPPERAAAALAEPWREVRERLGRSGAVISYLDLIVNNWRLLDSHRPDPMRLPNMRLLVPTVDNREERTFYLTQTAILAHCTPVVGAVVRAHEAVVTDDRDVLESALVTIIACLDRVVRESLLEINPNPSSVDYVDPVVWAKTVAPFAVPTEPGIQGPSGTSSPIFNTLDVFFGRKRFETFLGKEIFALRGTYPRFWREFIAALHEISVADYVATRGTPHLRGLFHEAVYAYSGPNGFLGRHRMKVFGYLESAFKVGRSVTIGGFSGLFEDRTWDLVDTELEKSRVERVQDFPQSCYQAKVLTRAPSSDGGPSRVVLDVSGTGLRYEAGDRCGVLAENDEALVVRTLSALNATGDETIALTPEWKLAIKLRAGVAGADLSLRDLLRYGRIRPVLPRTAEALHAVTQNAALARAMREGRSTQWELWDLLDLLTKDGFDARNLFAHGDDEPSTTMCGVVPPAAFRMYSITSVLGSAQTESATEVSLVVGPLRYTEADGTVRNGTASNFLTSSSLGSSTIPVVIEHPPRFSLPRSARVPIVMIAGGTGVAPFVGFISERQRQLAAGEAWLLLALRTRKDFCYGDALEPAVRSGMLRISAAFSQDDVTLVHRPGEGDAPGTFVFEPGKRRRIPELLADEDVARRLDELLRPTAGGGKGASLYLCGRSRFARAAVGAVHDLFGRFGTGTDAERKAQANQLFRQLSADGKVMQEVFSGEAPEEDLPLIAPSELARYNDAENGYRIGIHGRVYDLTEYVHLHPGGLRILTSYCGTDASDAYARAHAGRSEVDATREMFAVGRLAAVELGGDTVRVDGPQGPRIVALAGIHRAWLRQLFLVAEMQNALRNDQALQNTSTTRDEPISPRSPYRLQKAVETHARFTTSYLGVLAADSWPNLWQVTYGFMAQKGVLGSEGEGLDGAWMAERLARSLGRTNARWIEAVIPVIDEAARGLSELEQESGGLEHARVSAAVEVLEEEDARLLASVKEKLRRGVALFEELGTTTPAEGGTRVVALLQQLVAATEGYVHVVERRLQAMGWVAQIDEPSEPKSVSSGGASRTVLSTSFWHVEEDVVAKVVFMRRSPLPFSSVDEIVKANDGVISQIRDEHAEWGVIVDMRQAPSRNDPSFENAMRRLREVVTERFSRLAVLLESTVGLLQVTRLQGQQEERRPLATMSESAAWQFARGDVPTVPRTSAKDGPAS